jgi:Fic family protein
LYDKSIYPVNIQNELNDLISWYKTNISKINPLIRIAVVIYRLVRIYPFIALNKISLIALTDYLLYKNGYLTNTFIPTTRIFDTFEDEFLDAWNTSIQSGSSQGDINTGEDITIWIERFIRNIGGDIQEAKEAVQKKTQEEDRGVKQPFLDLNKRQLKILKYLQTIPTVKREDYVQMMAVSTMTAYRDINELVDKKLLKTAGRGRGTKYMLRSR